MAEIAAGDAAQPLAVADEERAVVAVLVEPDLDLLLGVEPGLFDKDIVPAQARAFLASPLNAIAVALDISHEAALLGLLFSIVENQVLVCVKSVPLGQVAGQSGNRDRSGGRRIPQT